ncbi:MAG: hypothetical protein JGK30_19315 [Microcoleus sp. PH2017_40_RAT_O_B]|uniref:hypothetical protein n=1 Tax=unclassified Microcoleus TaxID=2642155 RepID=UPI001D3E2FA1|nr:MULTISPECIES: hypothetical protein [unclassified Microcoleus]MCC3573273.1 hypothetical protein [Microcoleus sp. PH2017_34_RAT_O_A]MCC3611564.1 hypothetical protein [Microcoleus sp. PH2017_40_RAT_O_B]
MVCVDAVSNRRVFNSDFKFDRTFLSNAIAHQSKNAKIPKTPAVGNRCYTDKTRLRGLKISPDNFRAPNTLFVGVRRTSFV